MSLDAQVRLERDGFTLDADLLIAAGETVALVGPNGAGKTSLLRAMAGLERIDAGAVSLGGRVLANAGRGTHLPATDRRLGVMLQQPHLFPHLTVAGNVAFGPRARGADRAAAARVAEEWLTRVGLAGRGGHRPGALSGGEAQRVALARALATDPAGLLLDEPLSSVDLDARHALRHELRRHLDAFTGPALLVTHDAVEAATLADRLVVLEAGRVVQTGTIAQVTRRPRSAWAAALAGVNLHRGRVVAPGTIELPDGTRIAAAGAGGGEVFATIPPHAVALYRDRPDGTPRNAWRVRVGSLEALGERVRVVLAGDIDLVAEVTPAAVAALDLGAAGELWAVVKATEVTVYPA